MYLIAILLEVYKQLKSLQKEASRRRGSSIKLDSGKEARFSRCSTKRWQF
jgi:hypothetical protein